MRTGAPVSEDGSAAPLTPAAMAFEQMMARMRYRDGKFGEFKLGTACLLEKWYYRNSNFQNWCTVENSDAFTYIGCHYGDLVAFITSGPLVAAVIEGPDAIASWRTMMGATDPAKAAPGTIRGDLATVMSENVSHGSDSPESAAREIALFFPGLA